MQYIVARLYGPVASWGEIATGDLRLTNTYPTKSALMGIIASSLGVPREDAEKQEALTSGYTFGIKVLRTGSLLQDFHTIQVPPNPKYAYRSRKDELGLNTSKKLSTKITLREYMCDALCLVAIKALPHAPYSLEHIKYHLLHPKYHLFLGRKSCTLAAPLDPAILDCINFEQALDTYAVKPLLPDNTEEQKWFPIDSYVQYYWEGENDILEHQQVVTRRDQSMSRKRWQFTEREENFNIKKREV